MKKTRIMIAALAGAGMLLGASSAFAQSTVTGTLSSGGSSSSNNGSSSLTGTVSGGSSGSATTGGGGGGSGSNITDICPNLSGTQSTLPAGYVMQNGNCVASNTGTGTTGTTGTGSTGATGSTSGSGSAVLGTSTGPNVPNTGAGGDAASTLMVLVASAVAALGGARLMLRRQRA